MRTWVSASVLCAHGNNLAHFFGADEYVYVFVSVYICIV